MSPPSGLPQVENLLSFQSSASLFSMSHNFPEAGRRAISITWTSLNAWFRYANDRRIRENRIGSHASRWRLQPKDGTISRMHSRSQGPLRAKGARICVPVGLSSNHQGQGWGYALTKHKALVDCPPACEKFPVLPILPAFQK